VLKEHFTITLETREITYKGWNWGVTDFQGMSPYPGTLSAFHPNEFSGQDLVFVVSDKTALELSLTDVANSNIAGKTEVSLEFTPSSHEGFQSDG
jgi:structure-specific recognition protein 1